MPRFLFKIVDDVEIRGRWFLKGPVDSAGRPVDPFIFSAGERVVVASPLRYSLRRDGSPLDFTFADLDVPVVRRDVGELIERISPADVQRIPVSIDSRPGCYDLLNVTTSLACVDESRSDILFWTPDDGRPDLVGRYRMVTRLVVDPAGTERHEIFRVKGWELALIVSLQLKEELEKNGVSGVTFRRVVDG